MPETTISCKQKVKITDLPIVFRMKLIYKFPFYASNANVLNDGV